jgi:hypothetical protein
MIAPSFLQAAAEAGLVHQLGPIGLVADEYLEPITGRRQCLVEHWWDDRADASVSSSAAYLIAALEDGWPQCDDALVRAGNALPGLAPYLTYLSFLGEPANTDDLPVIVASTPAELTAVEEMLVAAFHAASEGRNWSASKEALHTAAREVMSRPSRVSFLVAGEVGVTGHATLLVDAHDDPSDQDYVELLDVLVKGADTSAVRRARRALVEHAKRLAHDMGRPLLGHVVHETSSLDRCARVVRSLRGAGWQSAFQYQLHSLARDGAATEKARPRST